jgi:hypothetical protein
MFFDTPWTRLSDSQKQKGISPINSKPTASEYFTIGPVRGIMENDYNDGYYYRPSNWKKEPQTVVLVSKFIKINGKEIY